MAVVSRAVALQELWNLVLILVNIVSVIVYKLQLLSVLMLYKVKHLIVEKKEKDFYCLQIIFTDSEGLH